MTAASTTVDQTNASGTRSDNPRLALWLGLCPLLAVTNSLDIGLALGLSTLAILSGTPVLVSALRHWIPPGIRLPAIVLVIAALVTAAELLCQAFLFDSYFTAGVFLPLIIANGSILGRPEDIACQQPVAALLDGFRHGAGFAALLIVFGGFRQLLGTGFTLAMAPAGAFFALGLLVAARNAVADR